MNFKTFGILHLSMLLLACASNVQKTESTTSTVQISDNSKQSLETRSQSSLNEPIHILVDIPYSNSSIIPEKVKTGCTKLGRQLSNSVVKYARKQNINVLQIEDPLPAVGRSIDLKIRNVLSQGHAFGRDILGGHQKGIIVDARLMIDGTLVSNTAYRRMSDGGFWFGDFKSSCSVLSGIAKELGKDISEWLSTLF